MNTIIKIAFRNIKANKRRSVLLGFAIFVSSFLLLFSNAALNGVREQVSRGYINIQAGNTIVMWESMKNTSNTEPGRFINTSDTISFKMDKDKENLKAIDRLDSFLEKNADKIENSFKVVRRNASFKLGDDTEDTLIVYGLSDKHKKHLEDKKVLSLVEGDLSLSDENSLCISKDRADKNNVKVGDTLKIEVITKNNESKTKNFKVSGIYNNGAEYDNWYAYMPDKAARELYDMGNEYFDVNMIFLKDKDKSQDFAEEMDNYLLDESDVLRAESYIDASQFYNTMPTMYKSMYNIFCVFLLCIIAIGLRSTIKMNIFERMKEFGTFRAIGYSRLQTFLVILFEILFLSIIALALAFIVSIGPIIYAATNGIYVGPGNISNSLGGEIFYASFEIADVIMAFILIVLFSVFSVFSPAAKLCFQNISDIMSKRQKKVKIIKSFFTSVFEKKKI